MSDRVGKGLAHDFRQRSCAIAQALTLDSHKLRHRKPEVCDRCAFGISHVLAAGDASPGSARDQGRKIAADMKFATAQPRAKQEHHIVQQAAVTLRNCVKFFHESSELFDVKSIQSFKLRAHRFVALVVGPGVMINGLVKPALDFQG